MTHPTAPNSCSSLKAKPHAMVLLSLVTMITGTSLVMAQPTSDQPSQSSPAQTPSQPPSQAPTSAPNPNPSPSPTASPDAQTQPPKAPEPLRNTKEWNLGKNNLAIDGHDPVAYHPEFGGKATPGSDKIVFNHMGVVYRFASEANRQEFQRDPSKYEPAHGGWCSWAVKDADKVEIDPKSFIVKDGRLFLFYKGFFGDTRARWLKLDHQSQVKQADDQWKKLSNEEPHLPKPPAPPAPSQAPQAKPTPQSADPK